MLKVISILLVLCVTFSCSGQEEAKVAFVSGETRHETEIYIKSLNSTSEVRETDNNWEDSYPCWSYDDTRIAFKSLRDGTEELYVMEADGSNPNRITYFNKEVYPGVDDLYIGPNCWSADGGAIVFSFENTIYMVNWNGTNLIPYSQTGKFPGFSPDGKHISFSSISADYSSINIMDVDGNHQKEVLLLQDSTANCSSWSPDSKKISCTSGPNLFILELSSGETRLLVGHSSPEATIFGADWSPSGDEILYSQRGGQIEGSLQYIVDVKNKTSTLFTPRLFTGLGTWSNNK